MNERHAAHVIHFRMNLARMHCLLNDLENAARYLTMAECDRFVVESYFKHCDLFYELNLDMLRDGWGILDGEY